MFQAQQAKAARNATKSGMAGPGASAAMKVARASTQQATDQIAKIGGIVGAQGVSNQERLARDTLDQQRMMNEKLERIASDSAKTSENTTALKED